MRYLFGFMCVLALGVMGCGETAGTGGTGGDGGVGGVGGGGVGGVQPREFEAGPAVAVSGPSPIADCEEVPPEGWAHVETEPWIVVNPTNRDNVVGLWIQDRNPRRALVAAVSMDGGATWESVVLPGLSKCSGGEWDWTTDPWLAFSPNGDLHASALSITDATDTEPKQSAIVAQKSTDGGLTWTQPSVVSEYSGSGGEDKESITADPFDACSIYVTWTRFTGADADLMFSRSTDCGETWEDPKSLFASTPAPIGAQLLVLPDGTLVNLFTEFELNPVNTLRYMMRSTDKGETWPAEPDIIGTLRGDYVVTPDNNPQFVRRSAMDVAVDRNTGALYMVWDQLFGQPMQIAFSSSSDGGLTWSTPIQVDRTPPNSLFKLEQAFMPSVEVSDDGTIGITYYNFQNETLGNGQADTDHWFIHCDPGATDCNDAESWSPPLRLTQDTFDILNAPLVGDLLFLGDYVGLTSSGSDFFAFFPVTTEDDPANAIFVPIRAR
jgi:hypothetical protein